MEKVRAMKTALVIPSIQKLNNLIAFKSELKKYGTRVIVVDEGDNREENSEILDGLDFSFFGPGERKDILGSDVDVIPQRCHAETSFGFLQAYREGIIPAFYQMYMNYEGLDRYCDIWSGLFIKKICDHLGKNISLGQPVVEHRKTERSTFKDLRAEHEGMAINETLWKVVRDAEIEGKNYRDAYDSLTDEIIDAMRFHVFPDKLHYKMMLKQIWGMRRWLELFE